MRFKISVPDDKLEEVVSYLQKHETEIDSDGEYVISINQTYPSYPPLKDNEGNKKHIATTEIMCLESFVMM